MFKSVAVLCVLVLGASAYPQVRNWQNRAVAQAVIQPVQTVRAVPVQTVRAVPVQNVVVQKPVAVVPVAKSYGSEAEIPIVRFESDVSPVGYNYNYETGNGISAESSGTLRKVDNADVLVQQGSYRYTAPDGTPVVVTYVADENGFQPQSDLLPVPPPVPEAIQRSLRYIQEHPSKEQDYVVVAAKKY